WYHCRQHRAIGRNTTVAQHHPRCGRAVFMKRFAFVLLLMAGLAITAGDTLLAQRPAGDAASFAAFTGYRAVPNITYTTASGVELKLDFYGPARPSGPLPTAI